MNVVVLVGRLGRDPELRYVPTGDAVANFSIAIDERPGRNGERRTTWLNVVAWKKLAEIVVEHLQKGSRVGIRGRLQSRSYENSEGQKRNVVEVVAEEIRFLDTTKKQQGQPEAERTDASEGAEDDVPF